MKRATLVLLLYLLMTAMLSAQRQQHDYSIMTPAEIEQLRQDRHAFYKAKSQHRDEAIKKWLLNQALKLDGNQADYDVRYYDIDISLDFNGGTISGFVDYKIMSVTSSLNAIDLNLRNELTVSAVTVNGQAAAFSHTNHILSITTPTTFGLNEEFDMRVTYSGTPYYAGQAGMEFAPVWGYNMCWTNCEPYESRYWWPCKDYPADKPDSVDLYIEYPSAYTCVSNGAIISDTDIGGGRKRIHYKHRYSIATYLIAIACATFVVDQQTWNYDSYSTPVYSYTMPNAGSARSSFLTYMLPVLTNLSDAYTTYPFADEKAGNAHYGWGGAMEHQTCSFYNPGFYDEWVIAHETGHQWWGDMITCKTFNHIWLNEGFASYSEPLHWEKQYGTAAYFNYLQSQKFLGGGTVYVENVATDDIFDGNLSYDKGSWVVHMLRGVLGDSLFFVALDNWANSQFKYGSATTQDLADVVSATAGEDMNWFFNQWIYGEGSPAYYISWLCEPDGQGAYQLTYFIEQRQSGGTYFEMPIHTTFQTTGADLDTVIQGDAFATQVISLTFADSVTNIIFDPDEWILRGLTTVPFSMHMTTVSLPNGYLNTPYYFEMQSVGGVEPYTWTLIGGDIPFGLTFAGDTVGVFSGTPSWKATYYFSLRVQDSDTPPKIEERDLTITILDEQQGILYGDANGDGIVNITDAVFIIDYIFNNGAAPNPYESGDANCDTFVNISDAVFIVSYIFGSGSAPGCN